jgi:8-oxo-dGTP pyrophosphatase MutT (NUDIX family)
MNLYDILNTPSFAHLMSLEEADQLETRYGPFPVRLIPLEVSTDYLQHWKKVVYQDKDKRGEIALVIQRQSDRRVLFHTKSFYPRGIYRIPTGGLEYQESAESGLKRELWEETGLQLQSSDLLGVIAYEFFKGRRRVPFFSFLYHVYTSDTDPQVHDEHEDISGFKWQKIAFLETVSERLKNIKKGWESWGIFRALPHDLALEILEQKLG